PSTPESIAHNSRKALSAFALAGRSSPAFSGSPRCVVSCPVSPQLLVPPAQPQAALPLLFPSRPWCDAAALECSPWPLRSGIRERGAWRSGRGIEHPPLLWRSTKLAASDEVSTSAAHCR